MVQGSASYNRVFLVGFLSVLGLFTYLYLRMIKENKKYTVDLERASSTVKTPSIAETITAGYNKSLKTLTPAEIKKYAGWIDRIEAIATSLKSSTNKNATAEMVFNAKLLKGMSDANLTAVINYWEALRKRKILNGPIFNVVYNDTTETLPALLRRIQDISI